MKRLCKDWISDYVSFMDNTEPPKVFHEAVAISTIAACLRRKCCFKWGCLTFFPNMYIILVGPPGTRKGTAMQHCREFLLTLGIPIASEAITKEAVIKMLMSISETEEVEGSPMTHSSLTLWSEEFTVLIGYKDQHYIAWLCDWYDCESPWWYRTKNKGEYGIEGICVNLLGATTPDTLLMALPVEAIGGGFSSRVLFVASDERKKVVFPFLDEEVKERLITDLQSISMLRGTFRYTKDFVHEWEKWYVTSDEPKNPNLKSRYFQAYLSRRAAQVAKLSMIMSASESDSMTITGGHLLRAIETIERFERSMHTVFIGYGRNELASVTAKVIDMINSEGVTTVKKLLSMFFGDATKDDMMKILATIEAMGVATLEYDKEMKDVVVRSLMT